MRGEIQKLYELCKPCSEHRISKPQVANEIDMRDAFENFYPGEQLNIDFAEKGGQDYMIVVCVLTGFLQVYEVRNKTSESALKVMREWTASYNAHIGFDVTMVQDTDRHLWRI